LARILPQPILAEDLHRIGEFLHLNLNRRISARDWATAIRVPWTTDALNHGFQLLEGDRVVGVYLAFYSARRIDDRLERFCNLGAWCVLPSHRLHSLLLLRSLLGQKGYHFTDFSPSGNTVSVNERLKFQYLDTTTVLMPNLPWPWPWPWPSRGVRVIARHVVIVDGSDHCYVIFRRDRRKKLPLFASLLYASNPALLLRRARLLGRHLLFNHGVMMTLAELRVFGGRPSGSILLSKARPKMFKSESLGARDIDYLYSELACVPW
jgi:hypothetical protein